MEYKEYLKSDKWKKKRNQAKYWHGRRCAICRKKRTDVHHKTYKNLGNEDAKWHLIPLCREHHFGAHDFCRAQDVDLYHGTLRYITLMKPKRPRRFSSMSPFEREQYLGKG